MGILCVGQLVADIVVHPVERVDYAVDTALVDQIEMKSGGDAMNTAMALKKLGNEVSFVGRVGRDDFARFLQGRFDALGVRHLLIESDEEPTCSTIVLINSKAERTFLHCAGANKLFRQEDVPDNWIEKAELLHVGGAFILPSLDGEGAARLFRRAHEMGALTSMDVTFDPSGRWLEVIRPCLPHLDYFLPSINEAKRITGTDDPERAADALLELGVKHVAVKLGERGCLVKDAGQCLFLPGYPADVVDTTGAGDAFVAGFLTGVARGLPLSSAAKLGCAAGSVAVRQFGAIPEQLTLQMLSELTGEAL